MSSVGRESIRAMSGGPRPVWLSGPPAPEPGAGARRGPAERPAVLVLLGAAPGRGAASERRGAGEAAAPGPGGRGVSDVTVGPGRRIDRARSRRGEPGLRPRSFNTKSYISLQQPRTDFYIGIRQIGEHTYLSNANIKVSSWLLTFILAFDRLVNIPISDSSAPPLPRTHARTHTPKIRTKQNKKKLLSYVSHVRMVPDTLIG